MPHEEQYKLRNEVGYRSFESSLVSLPIPTPTSCAIVPSSLARQRQATVVRTAESYTVSGNLIIDQLMLHTTASHRPLQAFGQSPIRSRTGFPQELVPNVIQESVFLANSRYIGGFFPSNIRVT
jgi:hypothetical protein